MAVRKVGAVDDDGFATGDVTGGGGDAGNCWECQGLSSGAVEEAVDLDDGKGEDGENDEGFEEELFATKNDAVKFHPGVL